MKIIKYFFSLVLFIGINGTSAAQKVQYNAFIRTPQVVNYNINLSEVVYNPAFSVGTGISYQTGFLELGIFINKNNLFGFYTFFGTTLKTTKHAKNLKLHTNLFGEIAYLPGQQGISSNYTYTSGICLFLNYTIDRLSLGIPLCTGLAYNQKTISLNTRVIMNVSISLNK